MTKVAVASRFGLTFSDLESMRVWQYQALIAAIEVDTNKQSKPGMTPVMS